MRMSFHKWRGTLIASFTQAMIMASWRREHGHGRRWYFVYGLAAFTAQFIAYG